jgi:beta-fructofuranosidase
MNDPNGLIHWKGQVHLFYQYNPRAAYHEKIHWGHAASRDLVHWEDLPVALSPDPGEPDELGCWSGCAVDDNGVPTLVYTAVHPQTVCLATSTDDLLTWQKAADNPVIDGPPAEFQDQTGGNFRDPFVWRDQGRWLMAIGSKIEGKGGLVLLYESPDLHAWKYLHPLVEGDVNQYEPFWTGTMWECPNLVDFGEKQVLIISSQATMAELLYVFYYSGELRGEKFHVERQEILVPSTYFYAPQVMVLDDGRAIMWGWVREGRSSQAAIKAGWNGTMSLPLELSLSAAGLLKLAPARELEQLRGKQLFNGQIQSASDQILPGVSGEALEISAQLEAGPGAAFGLIVRHSPDGREVTRIVVQDQQVFIDREHSSLDPDVKRNVYTTPVEYGETISLRVYLDHSILEVFVNDQSYLVSRIYPTLASSLGVGIFGNINAARLEIWELGSIWA